MNASNIDRFLFTKNNRYMLVNFSLRLRKYKFLTQLKSDLRIEEKPPSIPGVILPLSGCRSSVQPLEGIPRLGVYAGFYLDFVDEVPLRQK
ncbi:hypothetical protein ACN6AX_25505 [Paenibacillus polymyxa]|uniref:hypothetical protein n=1 Tax=Paenibacillus polymyxa TaxID=1406 RepID=UPI00211D76C2|nr:hypothetical protein [Paenibacillus polymyxa]